RRPAAHHRDAPFRLDLNEAQGADVAVEAPAIRRVHPPAPHMPLPGTLAPLDQGGIAGRGVGHEGDEVRLLDEEPAARPERRHLRPPRGSASPPPPRAPPGGGGSPDRGPPPSPPTAGGPAARRCQTEGVS